MNAKTCVFVYGTLLAGEPNHAFLAEARPLGEARTVTGYRLHDLGAYPAMVEAGSEAVSGEVYEVSADTLERLDRLEGVPRLFRRTIVLLGSGLVAQSYVMDPTRIGTRPVVEGGSWRARSRVGFQPPNAHDRALDRFGARLTRTGAP